MLSIEHQDGDFVHLRATGKLTTEDYRGTIPLLEAIITENAPLRVLIDARGIEGVEAGALWLDAKFDMKHGSDIAQIAFVGDQAWEKWLTKIFSPMFKGEVRYFDAAEMAAAESWINDAR